MKKLIPLALLALMAASPVLAGIKNCNTVLVNQTLCANVDETLLYVAFPETERPRIMKALGRLAGWRANIPCTEAMVALGQCTVEQLGQLVPNPQTREAAVTAWLARYLQIETVSGDAEDDREATLADLQARLTALVAPAIRE